MAQPSLIEQQAAYRPDISTKLLNLFTGGLYGGLTGQLERQSQSNRAKMLLQNEAYQELAEQRQFDRALLRQKMTEALKLGIPVPEGLSGMGGQPGGVQQPSLDELIRQGRMTRLKEELKGLTSEPVVGDMSEGELEGKLQRARTTLSSETGLKQRADEAAAILLSLQGRGAYASPINVSTMTPAQKIAEADIAGRAYKEATERGAMERQEERERKAISDWQNETNSTEPNEERLRIIYNNLPRQFQLDPAIRAQVNLQRQLGDKDRERLRLQREAYQSGANIAESLSKLVGNRDYAEVSQLNFNQLANWKRDQGQKLFTQSPEWAVIDDILQQAEQYMAGKRKDLFGASLTGNELVSANRLFGDPNKANFIPRLLNILDRQFKKDFIAEEFTANRIFVEPDQKKLIKDARDRFNKVRPLLQSAILGDVSEGQQPAAAPVPAAGVPAPAPAARTAPVPSPTMEQIDALIKQTQEELKRLKSQNK